MEPERKSLLHVLALVESSDTLAQSQDLQEPFPSHLPRSDLKITHKRRKRRVFVQPCLRLVAQRTFPLPSLSLEALPIIPPVPSLQSFLGTRAIVNLHKPQSDNAISRTKSEWPVVRVRETLIPSRLRPTRESPWYPLRRRRTRVLVTKSTLIPMCSASRVAGQREVRTAAKV